MEPPRTRSLVRACSLERVHQAEVVGHYHRGRVVRRHPRTDRGSPNGIELYPVLSYSGTCSKPSTGGGEAAQAANGGRWQRAVLHAAWRHVLDLMAELEAAARLVDEEGHSVADGNLEREPVILAPLERLDVVTSKLRAMLAVGPP